MLRLAPEGRDANRFGTEPGRHVSVVAVIDGYRVTGPARQLLAAATHPGLGAGTTLAVFARGASSIPLVDSARKMKLPVVELPDRFPGDPATAAAFLRLARSAEVDVLQTHGYKANVLAAMFAGVIRKSWIAFLHGETFESRRVRLYFRLERLAVRRAPCVVVVSEEMARETVAHGVTPGKIRVVPNACLVTARAADGVADLTSAGSLIGVVGRLSPEKGVDVALRALALVLTRCPSARLVIAGEGAERAALGRLAVRLGVDRAIEWVGYRDDPTELYCRLALLLVPSRSEGLPNVALEAMDHGLAIVATSVGGVPEIVRDGVTGFLVASEDSSQMAERIVTILGDPELSRRMGAQGRTDVTSRFSLDARAAALAALYRKVVA